MENNDANLDKERLIKLFTDFLNFQDTLKEVQKQQKRYADHLDQFIGLLTFPDVIDQRIDALWVAIEELKNQPERVPLFKGTIDIPRGELGQVMDTLQFYTIKATGECGMSLSALAKLADVNKSNISRLEKTLLHQAPSEYLQSYVGQDFTLLRSDRVTPTIGGKDAGNLTLYKADFCAAVITHYAMKGSKPALRNLGNFCLIGINTWIQNITGWKNNR